MKNIFTLIAALLLSVQLQAAVQTFKFIDETGKEPREKSYDQHCYLVDCADGRMLFDNHVTIAVGDTVELQLPKNNSFLSDHYYAIEPNGYELHNVQAEGPGIKENCFTGISFVGTQPGTEKIGVHFARKVNFFTAGSDPVDELLGDIEITVY